MGVLSLPLSILVMAAYPVQGPANPAGPASQFGGGPSRNMVNLIDKNAPVEWCVEEGKEKNVKWQAELGTKTYGGPIVAGGRVFVGTNNAKPRDARVKGLRLVLMCFDEKNGKFLWQNAHPAPVGQIFKDVNESDMGLLSTPAVDGDRVYYVLSQCVVVCADVKDGKVIWQYDMHKELKVVPYHCSNCSPLVAGNHIFIVTGNGIDEQTAKVPNPEAPSFIALTRDGKLAWKSSLPGERIIEGQWSNPAYAVINGKPQVIFPGGDAGIYSFEPDTGKPIWQFRCYPKKDRPLKDGMREIDNYIIATPVIHDNKVYVGLGVYPEHPHRPPHSWFVCIDATKIGDVSPAGGIEAKGAKDQGALVWKYGGVDPEAKKKRKKGAVIFGRTISTCAIHDGLVYIPEESGFLHCLDAKTGQRQRAPYDFLTDVWGSPYYVDGKVYIGTGDGDMFIFRAGKDLKIIEKVNMDEKLHGTPVVANGVLFVATMSKLYAIGK